MKDLMLMQKKIAIKSVLDNYVESIVVEDIDLYSKVMWNDSTMVNVGGSEGLSWIEGWDDLKVVIIAQNDSFSETNIEVAEEKIYINPIGEFAWAVNRWNLRTILKNGYTYRLPLRCSWVLEKRNNQWIIVHFHKSFGVKSLSDFQITEE
jgi:ketosteroid isomerase-like protein